MTLNYHKPILYTTPLLEIAQLLDSGPLIIILSSLEYMLYGGRSISNLYYPHLFSSFQKAMCEKVDGF
jgi:hypothetical protein